MAGEDEQFNPKEPRRRMPKPVWVYPLSTVFIWGVALVLFFEFFQPLKIVLLGLLASASVAAALRPVADRIPGPRSLRALLTGLMFILVVAGLIFLASWLLVEPIQAQIAQWDQIEASLNGGLAFWGHALGIRHPPSVDDILEQVGNFISGQGLGNIVSQTAGATTTLAVVIAFVFIGSMYLLASPPGQFSRSIVKLLPAWRRPAMEGVFRDLQPQLRWWLVGTVIGMVSIGIASYVGYTAVGLKWALPLAIFAALTEAIPTVGPALTLVLALLLASTQGVAQIIGVSIVYVVVQGLESYVLIPVVMKKAVNIPPAVSLFTLILWGKILGISGLLLAIPLDLVIWSLLQHYVVQANDAGPNSPEEIDGS